MAAESKFKAQPQFKPEIKQAKVGENPDVQIPTTNINIFEPNVLADPHQYQEKRKLIRLQKAERLYQNLWRIATVSSLAVLAGWGATLPEWNLRNVSQIKIKGNQLLPSETLIKMVPIAFPQSIFTVQPQAIAAQIEKVAPVNHVKVERTLFPAQLVISLTERQPVARISHKGVINLIDPEGKLLPSQVYPSSLPKPELLLLVDNEALVSNNWYNLYKVISRQNLGITLIDWREPNNLILTTKLANVYLGVYSETKFLKQIMLLKQIQSSTFSQNLVEAKIGKIAHIDLSDPQYPLVERALVKSK